MIAAIVPAHNEAALIARCVDSLRRAAAHPDLDGESVLILVVADSCTDETARIAAEHGALTITVEQRNVGIARAAGAEVALAHGARWLAFTDADSHVGEDWLVQQLALDADAVCGTVQIDDWLDHPPHVARHFAATYFDRDDHRHIHGANLGVSADAYRRVNGFPPLPSHEDVALVHALLRCQAKVAWSALPRVTTSSRDDYRAPAGFGATLLRVRDGTLTSAATGG